ncbi:MAG TPA: hypothetical protein VGQ62_16150 [Chloroflexota bacterium]|jgi:hypothetical protein|nr:hypothetical protein [Chloroflexota bacterium]
MNDDDFAELFKTPYRPNRDATWDDVAREVQNLGKSVGDAFRAAWERQPNYDRVQQLEASLQGLMADVTHAIELGIATPEAEQAREQVTRLTETIRVAAERSTSELRPELLRLLREANAELRRLSGTDE